MPPSATRRRSERAVAALLAATLTAGVASAIRLQPPQAPRPAVQAEQPRQVVNARTDVGARTTAVRRLLVDRADAVLRKDRAAFLATVDPGEPGFRTRQASYLDALRDVPLASWDYLLDATREQPRTAALDRQHGIWWAPDVSVTYALAGFDRAPSLQPQGLTFVQRGGRWYVGADDDFATTGRRTAREVWDGGRVLVRRGGSCLVLGHAGQAALVRALTTECDAAVPRVTAVWGRGWAQRVVVVVPDSAAELDRLLPEAGDLSQIAAVATAELVDPASGYRPVGDRVVVNPANFARLGPLGRQVVMAHEVTHVASRGATGPQVPTWLVEGLADYVGYLGVRVPIGVAAEELRTDIRAGRVPAELPTDADFAGGRADLAQTYEQSWLAVRLLAARYGQDRMLQLYREIGSGNSLAAGLDRLGTTVPAFTRLWQADLRRLLS